MSSNFLQFNPTQANQETDAAYDADSTRNAGAPVDGVFPSVLANKAFYQWSTFITAFGLMMANKGFSVSDASLATLVSQLTNVLTTADVRGGLVGLAYSAGLTLDASRNLGWQITLAGNVGLTLTGAQVGDELTLVLIQDYTGGHTVAWPSSFGDALQPDPTPNSVSVMSFKVRVDGTVWTARPVLSSSGINSTPIGQGAPAAGAFTQLTANTPASTDNSSNVATTAWFRFGFAILLAVNGYVKFPAWLFGLTFQWGNTSSEANVVNTRPFNLTFSNACFVVVGCTAQQSGTGGGFSTWVADSGHFYCYNSNNLTSANWIAVGY